MTYIILTLDHLPPRELNPNQLRRQHWTVRSKSTSAAKNAKIRRQELINA